MNGNANLNANNLTPQNVVDWQKKLNISSGDGKANVDASNLSLSDRKDWSNILRYSNPNLLVNGDFSINQRNQTTYTGLNAYGPDRWRIVGEDITITMLSEGIKITNSSSANRNAIRQQLQSIIGLRGQILTLSIKVTAITGTLRIANFDGTTQGAISITSPGIYATSFTPRQEATFIRPFLVLLANSSADIMWIKLELGDTSTVFVPRLKEEELALCLNAYTTIRNNEIFATSRITGYMITAFSFKTQMANTPRLKLLAPVTFYSSNIAYTQSSPSSNAYWISDRGATISLNNFTGNPEGNYYARTYDEVFAFESVID